MRYSIKVCCRWRKRDPEIITTCIDRKKLSKNWSIEEKNPWATLCEKISYCYSVLWAAFIYCFKNIYRGRAEGGAGGALAPHIFARIKLNETKNNLTKKFSFTHSSLAPPLENLLRGPWSIILEKEQGKSRKGKNIRYANGRKPIKSLTYDSPLDYELSLLFGSVCCAGPKQWKKKRSA